METASQKTDHFHTVGYLIPSHSGKSFKVLVEVRGKRVLVGLVSVECLRKGMGSKPMAIIPISKFVIRPDVCIEIRPNKCVNGIREADPEKLSAGGSS